MREGDILAGQYRLCERVGRGAYGTVWRAEELRGGRAVVAIKAFHDQPDDAEMSLLAQLDHPHVLRYRATIEHEGQLCLLTDYADGGDVAQLLDAYPHGLPVEQVSEILRGVASALQYLHGMRVVHRDVKPANLLFVNGRVRLADVGLAKALERTATRGTSTASPLYAAPELYQGIVSTKVDIYAFGATAFELLAGCPPFDGTPFALMTAHLHTAPPALPGHVPEVLCTLVRACLEKRPEDRPQAVELLRVLEAPPASNLPEVRHERNGAMGDAGVNPKSTSKSQIPPSPRRVGRPLAALWSRLPWPGHPFRRGALVGGLVGLTVAGLLLFTTTAPGRAVVWGLGNAAIAVDRASSEGAHAVAWLSSEWFRRVGMFKYSRGNRHEAHENFKIAVAVTPWRAEPNFNLAVSCMDQGADREACHYLRQAIDLCGPNERALWHMAVSARERWGCSRGPVR